MAAESALGLGSPTIGWTAAAVEAVREFADPDYPGRIEARSLIITPGGDQIVCTAASRICGKVEFDLVRPGGDSQARVANGAE